VVRRRRPAAVHRRPAPGDRRRRDPHRSDRGQMEAEPEPLGCRHRRRDRGSRGHRRARRFGSDARSSENGVTEDRFGRIFRFESSSSVDLADARIRATDAVTRRGYRITADVVQHRRGPAGLEFTRGSRLRSVVAMSPDSWYVTGRVDFEPDDDRDGYGRVKVELNATRSAQVPSEAERAYWDREAAFLANATAGDDDAVTPPDTSRIRRQSLIAIAVLIGAVAIGAIIGNRVDGSGGSAALVFAIVGLLAGCFIVWRWLGLSEERPTS